MPRNKKTRVTAQEDLSPLTERILAQMGPEGSGIRKRLQSFYQKRMQQTPEPSGILEDPPELQPITKLDG